MALQGGIKETMKSYAQSAGYAEQALSSIKVVHTYGQELLEDRNYGKYLNRAWVTGRAMVRKTGVGKASIMSIIFAFYAYSFFWGAYLRWNNVDAQNGAYSGGVIITVMFTVIFGAFNLGTAVNHLKTVQEGQVAGHLAFEVIDHKPLIPSNGNGFEITRDAMKGHIEFKNVNFRYPTREELLVLDDFSCVFEEGKTTALVGASGSGKSTIIQLLERFYDPLSGSVMIDGQNLKDLKLEKYRQLVGYVGQEPVLFNTTIKENMLFAKPDATDDEIIEALKAAKAWDFIKKKMSEKGIDTHVGQAGG